MKRFLTTLSLLSMSALFLGIQTTWAQTSFLTDLTVFEPDGEEVNVNKDGSDGIEIDLKSLDSTELIELVLSTGPDFKGGVAALTSNLDSIEDTAPIAIDDASESLVVSIEDLTQWPNVFLRVIDTGSGIDEYHRLDIITDQRRPTISTNGTSGTSTGSGGSTGGTGDVGSFNDGCPVEQCPTPYEFGSAYFSQVGNILTHPEHDGPHFFYEESRIALGVRRALSTGLADPAVDPDFHGYDDGNQSKDQDGLALTTNNLNAAPASTSTSLQIETQHIAGPTCDPSQPSTCRLGTLITARYEKTGEPHQYSFKVLDVLDVKFEGRHSVVINPQDFISEGWIRLLYFDYDIDTLSLNPQQTRDQLKSWDGSHSGLSVILGVAVETIPGEIEDYQYQVNCASGLDIFTPGAIAFSKPAPCSAGTTGVGSANTSTSVGSSSTGTTGTTTGGAGSSNPSMCTFSGGTLTVICSASGAITIPGQPFGPPVITVLNNLYNAFTAVLPADRNAETRLRFYYLSLQAILPTL